MILRVWFKDLKKAQHFYDSIITWESLYGLHQPYGNKVTELMPFNPIGSALLTTEKYKDAGYKARILIAPRIGRNREDGDDEPFEVIEAVIRLARTFGSKDDNLAELILSGHDFYEINIWDVSKEPA